VIWNGSGKYCTKLIVCEMECTGHATQIGDKNAYRIFQGMLIRRLTLEGTRTRENTVYMAHKD
jgi:hypothetical protein